MLTSVKRALPAAVLGITALMLVAVGATGGEDLTPPAQGTVDTVAQGDDVCPGDRNCGVWDGDEDEDELQPPGDGPTEGGGGGGVCTFNNGDGAITVRDHGEPIELSLVAQFGEVVVPCHHETLGWYDGTRCYYGDFPPLVEIPEPPEGKTEEDGRYYYRTCLLSVQGELPNQTYTIQANLSWAWFDFEEVPEASPQDVVNQWLATIGLDGIEFALAPPETGAGLIGLPVWLGIAEGANSWGPIQDTDCIGTVCVEIEALVTEVAWEMGDGTVVTCARDDHAVWRSGMDFRAPRGCHHYYQRASRSQPDGRYQVTATSFWQVSWSRDAAGDSGVVETERTATTSVQIDEIQVLRNR